MRTLAGKTAIPWRWVLVGAELVLVCYVLAALVAGRGARQFPAVIGVAAGAAFFFLFLGSPFLVRSHGWLAIVGWCIAVATFFLAAVTAVA